MEGKDIVEPPPFERVGRGETFIVQHRLQQPRSDVEQPTLIRVRTVVGTRYPPVYVGYRLQLRTNVPPWPGINRPGDAPNGAELEILRCIRIGERSQGEGGPNPANTVTVKRQIANDVPAVFNSSWQLGQTSPDRTRRWGSMATEKYHLSFSERRHR